MYSETEEQMENCMYGKVKNKVCANIWIVCVEKICAIRTVLANDGTVFLYFLATKKKTCLNQIHIILLI